MVVRQVDNGGAGAARRNRQTDTRQTPRATLHRVAECHANMKPEKNRIEENNHEETRVENRKVGGEGRARGAYGATAVV